VINIDTYFEYRKGILFTRIYNINDLKEDIKLINKYDIKINVINLSHINSIDSKDINNIKINNKLYLIVNDKIKDQFKDFNIINNELEIMGGLWVKKIY